MNHAQKVSWSLVISVSLAMLLGVTGILVHHFTGVSMKAFEILAAAVMGTGVLLVFRFKPDKGAVTSDERDEFIKKNAGLAGLGAVYLLVILVSYMPLGIAPEAKIPTKWLAYLLPAAGLCQAYVQSIAILIQYGRGAKDDAK
jgi:hypothetical protein